MALGLRSKTLRTGRRAQARALERFEAKALKRESGDHVYHSMAEAIKDLHVRRFLRHQ